MNNKITNIEICQKLIDFFNQEEHKDLRFFQALSNMGLFKPQYDDRLNISGIDDPYYYNNVEVLKKINEKT